MHNDDGTSKRMAFPIRYFLSKRPASANDLTGRNKPLLARLLVTFPMLFAATLASAADLSGDFQALATTSYMKLSIEAGACSNDPSGWTATEKVSAIELGCVLQELSQVLEGSDAASQISDPERYAKILLEQELREPLLTLLEHEAVQRQPRVSSQFRFQLARYAFERGDWATADAMTSALGNRYSLTSEQRQFLLLARAIEWQSRSEHREAIKLYERFEPDSRYYAEARTNLAIAYLKQGWWTDAHRELESLLPEDEGNSEDEFDNRVQMLLGLSQLQQGFYRNAREHFRAISQDSRYVAYAWRGIGLSALYQEDYPGALNAFLQLKAANDSELPEGPFLVAFTYDQMNSLALAEASYTEAIVDYQQQLDATERDLQKLASSDWLPDFQSGESNDPVTTLASQKITQKSALWKEYQALRQLTSSLPSNEYFEPEKSTAETLLRRYRKKLGERYSAELELKREHLKSYLSQSQYGLATIYDRQ